MIRINTPKMMESTGLRWVTPIIMVRCSFLRPRPALWLQLARDERLHHLSRSVGLRTRLRDPLVLAALEHGQLAHTARRAIRRRELLLDRGQHVVVERALHDE